MTNWITHRQPTAADGDSDGDVFVPRDYPPSDNGQYVSYQYVGPGVPWKYSDCYAGPQLTEPVTSPVVRTFRSIKRSILASGEMCFDAVANDGTAWWRAAAKPCWTPHPPLPQPDQPGE